MSQLYFSPVAWLALVSTGCLSVGLEPVYFSLIVSGGENGYRSTGGIPSVDLALEAVQKNKILPGYNLTYDKIRNSKCTRTDSLDAFFMDIQPGAVPKIAVVGCGCSTATEPVAEISHYWNITQISFAAALSSLSDRSRFHYYFRTTPSFANYALTIMGLLNRFNWRQLAFITQEQNLFLKILSDFYELQQRIHDGTNSVCCFDNHDIEVENVEFEDNGDPVAAARQIFDQRKFHIFMLNCYSKFARKIICEASKRGYTYPHYGWIVFGWYPDRWWTEDGAGEHIDECTDEEIEEFLENSRALVIHLLPEPDDYNLKTDAGMSAKKFDEMYHERLADSKYDVSTVYIIAFDTIWTLALALNKTEEMRMKNTSLESCSNLTGALVPLNQFNYSNAYMGCIIKENFHQVNFTGVSGHVQYDENGTIVYARTRLSQYRERKDGGDFPKRFGYLDRHSNFSLAFESGENDNTLYPDGVPPDGTPITRIQKPHTVLVVVYYVLALCGVVFSVISCTFNFLYRNSKVIRLTTPVLSYVISSGAILMYLSVFVGILPTTDKTVAEMQCIVHSWLYEVGYLLVYGTVLAKMWRVYQIFHNPNPNKTILSTWHLVCVVCGVTGVGVLLILAKTVAQALIEPKLVTSIEKPEGTTASDIRVDYKVWQCYDSGSATFVLELLLFVYLGLLQLVGIILAFQTRKVKILVLNDSKSVAALIYISSIVLVVIVLITLSLRGYANVRPALFYGGIILLATVFLSLIFIPKVVYLHRDPTGKDIFSDIDPTKRTEKSENKENHSNIAAKFSNLSDSEKVTQLSSQLAKLEETVNYQKKRIAELEAIVNPTTQ